MTATAERDRALFPGVLWAAAAYALVTVVFAYPLSLHPGTTVFGDNPDTHFYMWTLSWDVHAFLHQPLNIFDANIFYPNQSTLAYSENQIGSAVIAAPILWATHNPVLAVNLVALIGCTLCGVGGYVLGRRLGLQAPAAAICGLVYAFAPARFVRTGQAYLGTVQWIPFALAAFHTYLDDDDRHALHWAAAFFSAEALTSGHGGAFLAVAMIGLAAYYVALGAPIAPLRRLRDLRIIGGLLLLPSALLYVPYRRVQIEMGLRRTLEDWAPTAQSFLSAPTHVQQWVLSWMPGLHVNETASAHLFPGFLPLLLACIAVWTLRSNREVAGAAIERHASRIWSALAVLLDVVVLASVATTIAVLVQGPVRLRLSASLTVSVRDALRPLIVAVAGVVLRIVIARRAPFHPLAWLDRTSMWRRNHGLEWRRDPTIFYVLLTVAGVWMSIGPPFGLWPLIYWMPGFSFIRLSSRFMLLAMLGLSVLSGIAVQRLALRFRQSSAVGLATAIGVLMLVEFAGMPLPVVPYAISIPPIDRWLATERTPFVVAEFPTAPNARYQTTYMIHAMAHWQKTVHGYSGFEAPLHTRLYQELRGFPDAVSLQRLRELGVTDLVVHEEMYRPGEWQTVQQRLEQFADRLTLLHEEGTGRVYALRPLP